CSPCRIPASHELLRTEPFHVKVSEWLWETLLLVRKITAEVACPGGPNPIWLSPPPFPTSAGLPRLSVPELRATFDVPLMPLVCACPARRARSELRWIMPTRDVVMSSR